MFLRKPWNLPESFDGLAAQVALEFETEQPYILDGEVHRTRSLIVEHGGEIELVR